MLVLLAAHALLAAAGGGFVIRIKSHFDEFVKVYWDDGKDGVYVKNLAPHGIGKFNTFAGHTMYVKGKQPGSRLSTVTVRAGLLDYEMGPPGKVHKPLDPRMLAARATALEAESDGLADAHQAERFVLGVKTGGANPAELAQPLKVRNLLDVPLRMRWEHDKSSRPAPFSPGEETSTNSYVGHGFIFTNAADESDVRAEIRVTRGKHFYVLTDESSSERLGEVARSTQQMEAGLDAYHKQTGIPWLSYWRRPPPALYMWPAEREGQIHTVRSTYSYYHCEPEEGSPECQPERGELDMTLRVVSTAPKVFIVDDFLSLTEIQHVKALGRKHLHRSTTNGFESATRTSSTAWLKRSSSELIDHLHRRVADLLQIDEALLQLHDTCRTCSGEMIQVVHYSHGQQYKAHHDFQVSSPDTRFITLLMYLTDQADARAGGETLFPKAAGGLGLTVHPGKGAAVLFYNLLEDGNGDDLTLHAALPVHSGEKWLANFWIWDKGLREVPAMAPVNQTTRAASDEQGGQTEEASMVEQEDEGYHLEL